MKAKRRDVLLERLLLWVIFFLCSASAGHAWQGKVVAVTDGDTIKVLHDGRQVKIRLYGIDCPEKRQAYGQAARRFTAGLIAGKAVDVDVLDSDRYGRLVAVIRVGSTNVNAELVKSGYAWVYRRYCRQSFCDDWIRMERFARNRGDGLWAESNPVPPWEWRHGKKKAVRSLSGPSQARTSGDQTTTAPQYHGNVKSMIFHAAKCKYYNCRSCSVTFASRGEAIAAGYRPCKICSP